MKTTYTSKSPGEVGFSVNFAVLPTMAGLPHDAEPVRTELRRAMMDLLWH